jgi:hypothetical protein
MTATMTLKKKPAPNAAFKYTRPDEVAECWDGVGEELYKVLWNLMSYVPAIPNIEDSGPSDHVGHGNLADLWAHLSADEAEKLNKLAEAKDAEWKEAMAKWEKKFDKDFDT